MSGAGAGRGAGRPCRRRRGQPPDTRRLNAVATVWLASGGRGGLVDDDERGGALRHEERAVGVGGQVRVPQHQAALLQHARAHLVALDLAAREGHGPQGEGQARCMGRGRDDGRTEGDGERHEKCAGKRTEWRVGRGGVGTSEKWKNGRSERSGAGSLGSGDLHVTTARDFELRQMPATRLLRSRDLSTRPCSKPWILMLSIPCKLCSSEDM